MHFLAFRLFTVRDKYLCRTLQSLHTDIHKLSRNLFFVRVAFL
nr:MAG TPA: hypothetical protein [Caudoviricetes sp.]